MTNVIDMNRLPKQEYMKPEIRICEYDADEQILAYTVATTGVDEGLEKANDSGNAWDEAMGRNKVWDNEDDW